MSSADSHSHAHPHGHGHHGHSHGRASPHPSQPMGWSILRMTLAARLTGAVAISAVLWAIVLLAMK
ncbi:MAG TPA: hypothetical protein VGC26_02890 [Afipia sp.]